MSSTHKPNPSHGQKVTTDPAGRRDPKLENSGPVAKDSLAADSLRSGGAFSAGNPTRISGSSGSSGTFAADPGEGGNVRTLYGKKEDILSSGEASHPNKDVREKAKETSIQGGGNQSHGAFNSSIAGGKLSTSKDSGGEGLSVSKYSEGDDNSGTEGRGSRHPTAGGGSGETFEAHGKKIPNTAHSQETLEPGLDWSKVSKDTDSTTDIGGPNDPGRAAVAYMTAQTARQDQGMGHSGGKIGDASNNYDLLNDSEEAPELKRPNTM